MKNPKYQPQVSIKLIVVFEAHIIPLFAQIRLFIYVIWAHVLHVVDAHDSEHERTRPIGRRRTVMFMLYMH